MGAKTWMIVYSNGNAREILNSSPNIDKTQTETCLQTLFPATTLTVSGEGDLSFTCPEDNEIYAGYFNGVFVVAASEFAIDLPSELPKQFITDTLGTTIQLHAMHSAVDWFAFAIWEKQKLIRSLSLSPDSGILENTGTPFNFEAPYWDGVHPAIDPLDDSDEYPLDFHPLELGEEALNFMFGYQLEGASDDATLEPESIPLLCFKRQKKAWWRFW
ncbi:hypothetical protein NF212_25200 [Parasalinivibrio latis]|uniref:DUF6928 family protein n=1 Tax=Parasalinivibrio latis TaxID=2952610 RepID=UPI0030E33A3B